MAIGMFPLAVIRFYAEANWYGMQLGPLFRYGITAVGLLNFVGWCFTGERHLEFVYQQVSLPVCYNIYSFSF